MEKKKEERNFLEVGNEKRKGRKRGKWEGRKRVKKEAHLLDFRAFHTMKVTFTGKENLSVHLNLHSLKNIRGKPSFNKTLAIK